MSMTITIVAIAASLAIGTYEGKRRQEQSRHLPRQASAPDDIDGCVVMYAPEERCECMEEELLNVHANERGQPVCNNCGRRRV